jgi:hypothetical protein
MRKLNYSIPIGAQFRLPNASWQIEPIAGRYEVKEQKLHDYGDGEISVGYICVSLDRPYQNPVEIAEMTLAYIFGEDVSAELDVVFSGLEYQPTGLDPYRVATEYEGTECCEPLWYLGESPTKYHIDVDFNTDNWCFFKLPWD